jgi:hypothetical protein
VIKSTPCRTREIESSLEVHHAAANAIPGTEGRSGSTARAHAGHREENLVGLYLTGSFALGDANQHSDVDVLAVTGSDVTSEQETAH